MANNKEKTTEQFSNEVLKEVFLELHSSVVKTINTSSVIDKLFSARVISDEDINDLDLVNHRTDKCRRLLIILRNAKNPRAFIELRQAIQDEDVYDWLVKEIDEKYQLMTESAVKPQVIRVASNPPVTPLDLDIDELRREVGGLTTENSKLLKENNRLLKENMRLQKELESALKSSNSVDASKTSKLHGANGVSKTDCKESKADDPLKTSRDANVALKRPLHHNPELLFTVGDPPKHSNGYSCAVAGVVLLGKYLYVVHTWHDKVLVFDVEDGCKKIKDIKVDEMKSSGDMVGSSVTSQLFINDRFSTVIWRVDLKTEVSDAFIKTGYEATRLSLVENRLLVTSSDSLSVFDILSGVRIKKIPLTEDMKKYNAEHTIESNRDSFFVTHGTTDIRTVSEIDSDGRVIRVFDNKQQLNCDHLALDSVGRLLVADRKNKKVVLFDEHLEYERILIDDKQMDFSQPSTLSYNTNNNRLIVGLSNGYVNVLEY